MQWLYPLTSYWKLLVPATDPLLDPRRLAAVAELGLSDSPQLEAFGRLTEVAKDLLGAPVSLVTLVTEGRQVHLGQFGLSEDRSGPLQLPLSHSFCQHVVRTGGAVVIDETASDPIAANNYAVREFGAAAYIGTPLRLAGGEVIGAFCALDLVPRHWTRLQLEHLENLAAIAAALLDEHQRVNERGLRDAVTGLPRLPLFAEQLRSLIAAVEPHEAVALIGVDLRDFASINDALGHAAGDAVLADVGLRLEQHLTRRRLPAHLCRLAGDTFIIATTTSRHEPRTRLQDDLLAVIAAHPAVFEGHEQALSARGATVLATGGATPTELVEAIKSAVRNVAADPDENQGPAAKRRRVMIRNRLWSAQSRNEFSLDYQPIYDLASRTVTGFEALLRWTNADLGRVSPDEFIPQAEQNGSIVPIGQWVIQQALTDLAHWRKLTPGRELTMAVNVAPEQLLVPTFVDHVTTSLRATGLHPEHLVIEVTERTLGEDLPALVQSLQRLRTLGAKVSVDDFGTGYSSLSRLATLPLDELKIDRSFVTAMNKSPRAHALVASIVAMAGALGLTAVAEGIETQQQHDALTAIGCPLGQGYLIARPAPADTITKLLPTRRTDAKTATSVEGQRAA